MPIYAGFSGPKKTNVILVAARTYSRVAATVMILMKSTENCSPSLKTWLQPMAEMGKASLQFERVL